MTMQKHSVMIAGHRTSVSLEPEFWDVLKKLAKEQDHTPAELITQIDANRTDGLSSALRVYILKSLLQKLN